MQPTTPSSEWSLEEAANLYSISGWGCGFYEIDQCGEVSVKVGKLQPTSLIGIARRLASSGINPPFVMRFPQILESRIQNLHEEFAGAIGRCKYGGSYCSLYPVKVNHQQDVVEDVIRIGRGSYNGLEVGSKPELIAAIGASNPRNPLIVVNGYKDVEFVDLALGAQNAGYRVCIVLETPKELDLILSRAETLGLTPELGLRARLSKEAEGHWSKTSEIFGLTPTEIISVVDKLQSRGCMSWLKMLHYHHGSQLSNLGTIRGAAIEAATIYAELTREGAALGSINVGGGLAVDYDGSQTASNSSTNYSIAQYADAVVQTIGRVLDQEGLPHPDILTESGRAISAPHSVVVFNLHSVSPYIDHETAPEPPEQIPAELGQLFREVAASSREQFLKNLPCWREVVDSLFIEGNLSLREKAAAETMLHHATANVVENLQDSAELGVRDILYANLSIFQSLPDHWAIDHKFPVMPLGQLDSPPDAIATISDLTCDSDGRIKAPSPNLDGSAALPVHSTDAPGDYFIGAFLTGAYQEAISNSHNLFGKPHIIRVTLGESEPQVEVTTEGQNSGQMLAAAGFDSSELIENYRNHLKAHRGEPENLPSLASSLATYARALGGYSYPKTEPQNRAKQATLRNEEEQAVVKVGNHAIGG